MLGQGIFRYDAHGDEKLKYFLKPRATILVCEGDFDCTNVLVNGDLGTTILVPCSVQNSNAASCQSKFCYSHCPPTAWISV